MPKCRTCGEEKPLDQFYLRKDTGRPRLDCKRCHGRKQGYLPMAERYPAEGDTKVCRSCGQEKPLDEFYHHSGNKRHRSKCRACLTSEYTLARQIRRGGTPWEAPLCIRLKYVRQYGPLPAVLLAVENRDKGYLSTLCGVTREAVHAAEKRIPAEVREAPYTRPSKFNDSLSLDRRVLREQGPWAAVAQAAKKKGVVDQLWWSDQTIRRYLG